TTAAARAVAGGRGAARRATAAADRGEKTPDAGRSGAGQRRRAPRRAVMADCAGAAPAAIQALSQRRAIAWRGRRGAIELHGRSQRPRSQPRDCAQLRTPRARQRGDVYDRAGATAAAVSGEHAAGQARPNRADPLFAAVTRIARWKSPGGIAPAGAYK